MNRLIIYQYINRLRKEDIINYCNSKGISVNNKDLDVVYGYIKNDYKRFLDNPSVVLNEVKGLVSSYTYNEIIRLYERYKGFI